MASAAAEERIYALVDYEDSYVQPLIVSALEAALPPELLVFIDNTRQLPSPDSRLLQWRQYEALDFPHLRAHPSTSLANSYVIRKALIRKHYLSATVAHWLSKHPRSALATHVPPSVHFEVDYAEFLDDALVEAWELKESWARNAGKAAAEREWWILKPGMSERGQGIRLFSSEEELQAVFEEWDPPSDDADEEEDEDDVDEAGPADGVGTACPSDADDAAAAQGNGIMTSHLRHFTAQPYIAAPFLLPAPHPQAGRKFHIRAYVLAVGALKIYVYRPMLALFAATAYTAPGHDAASPNDPDNLGRHLTNTCLQADGARDGSVRAFWSLPDEPSRPGWKDGVFAHVCDSAGEVFRAAAQSMSVHFQPLPNAFEVFGLDFLVDAAGTTWLLEVNAFPDFAQTGGELRGVVQGLMEGVVAEAVGGFFGVGGRTERGEDKGDMVQVLDIDLGRR